MVGAPSGMFPLPQSDGAFDLQSTCFNVSFIPSPRREPRREWSC